LPRLAVSEKENKQKKAGKEINPVFIAKNIHMSPPLISLTERKQAI